MKQINISFIAIFFIAIFFSSCKKSEVPYYSDVDKINFSSSDANDEFSDRDENKFHYTLEFQKIPVKEFELEVGLFVQGRAVDRDRKVSFKIADSTLMGVDMEIKPAIIKAGESRGKVKIVVKRPSTMTDVLMSYVVIDHENSDFEEGTLTRNTILISATDINEYGIFGIYEEFWEYNTYGILGGWCFGKIRFIYCYYNDIWDFFYNVWNYSDNTQIKEALEIYKSNPNNTPIYDETKFPEKVWIDFEN